MTQDSSEEGVVLAMLERFEKFRLPRIMDIKQKVDQGEKLSEVDIDFLQRVMEDAAEAKPYIDKRPDLQALYTQTMHLYNEISTRALENEQQG